LGALVNTRDSPQNVYQKQGSKPTFFLFVSLAAKCHASNAHVCLAPTFLKIFSGKLNWIVLIKTYLKAENRTNRIIILKIMIKLKRLACQCYR